MHTDGGELAFCFSIFTGPPLVMIVVGHGSIWIHDILTDFRGKNVQTGTCSKEAYVPID